MTYIPDTSAAIDALSGTPPIVPDAGDTAGPTNAQITTGPVAPTPAGQPSVWKSLVMGALTGLAGSAGSTHFGGGLARGAGGYLAAEQQKTENAQRDQQLQMESLKAADSHAMALQAAQRSDLENELTRIKISDAHDAAQELLEEHGFAPKLTISADNKAGMHAQAAGGLTTLASQHPDGFIPEVVTINSPFTPKDKNHEISVYTTFPQEVTKNGTGVLNLINQERAIHNLPALEYSELQIQGGLKHPGDWRKGAAEMANDAIASLTKIPPVATGRTAKEIAAGNAAIEANLQQTLDIAKGNKDANPSTIKLLESNLAAFQSSAANAADKAAKGEAGVTLNEAPANAEAARQTELAKENTPQGRATLAKTQAEASKSVFELTQEKREAADLSKPDPAGFTSPLTSKEYVKRYDAFTKSKDYSTLSTLRGSYQQFQDTVNHIAQTGEMTGAESVVGLFNAIGISATPLAGKGFRINQSTVSEHTEARGFDQAAYQRLLKLKNGDVITPKQLGDYANIAAGVYHNAYVNAADEAHRQGLPADFLPQGGGRTPDPITAQIYTDVVLHTNPKLAGNPAALKQAIKQAAASNGWAVQ